MSTKHRLLTRALLAGGAEGTVFAIISSRVRIETARLRVPGQPSGIPYEMIVTHSVSATLALLGWWLEHGGGISADAMGEVVDRLVMTTGTGYGAGLSGFFRSAIPAR